MKVSIFHNVDRDHFSGYRPGHALVRVFEAEVPDGMAPHQAAEKMFEIGNAPEEYLSGEALELAQDYRARELRSVSVGDVVAAGEVPLACASCGWEIVAGPIREVHEASYGSVPLRSENLDRRG